MASTNYRFVVAKGKIPFTVTDGNMVGLKISGKLIDGSSELDFTSFVSKVEVRETNVVLVVPEPKTAPVTKYRDTTSGKYNHSFDLSVYPEILDASSLIDTSNLEKQDMKFKDNCVYYFFNHKNFEGNMGGWVKESTEVFPNMFGAGGDKTAKTKLTVPYDGTYYVWGRSKDFATDRPATRTADVSVDGTTFETLLGTHKQEGYCWQLLGSVELNQGDHEISVHTSGNYARFDMLSVTDDKAFEPVNAIGTLAEIYNNNTYNASKVVPSAKPEKEIIADANRPNTEIAVKLNDTWMNFDVPPVIINGRTMVPMRAIFEALGCSVSWHGEEQTAVGNRNGKTVMVTIGSNDAFIAGESATVDQPPVLIDGRTLVPLRFISEAFGCNVEWEAETKSVFIEAEDVPLIFYFDQGSFVEVGTWTNKGDHLQGISNSDNENGDFDGNGAKPAKLFVNIPKAGKYRLWIRARDYATNQPGSRFFHAAVDGNRAEGKFGDHGKEGFFWEDGGVYELTEGSHTVELIDTSGFFARCNGVILCGDIDMKIPDNQTELDKLAAPYNPLNEVPMPSYPAHSKEN
ncbi:MAG: copper amine oxidase N-terminal domain-containing protein, partial [Clostridia bacterium]|nr:copper amine oxidase N-terminal domain-containing protein [Clostridia bacterium]